ncbi:MAG: helix-turn-helix transcriptional regulator [Opitutales bacterium]
MGASTFIVPSAMQAELVWANEREVEPLFQRQHYRIRDETSCWLVRSGRVWMTGTGGRVLVTAGNWLFPGAGAGEVVFHPGTRILSIRFRLLAPQGGRVFPQPEPLQVGSSARLLSKAENLVKTVAPWQASGSLWLSRGRIPLAANYAVEAAFADWLSAYVEVMEAEGHLPLGVERGDERVLDALGRIARHPMRKAFREAELASVVGVGQRHLRRLVELETGASPYAHYDQRRLEMARHALRETAMPVKAVAYDLGFRAPSHFSNWFSKRMGCGPREFRNHARQSE